MRCGGGTLLFGPGPCGVTVCPNHRASRSKQGSTSYCHEFPHFFTGSGCTCGARKRGSGDRLGRRLGLGTRGEYGALTARRPRLTLSTDPARELHVLRGDRHALGVQGAEIRVLKEADELGLRRLLQREDCRRLEAEIRLHIMRNLTHKALERQFADEELRGLLLAPDLAESDRAGAEAGLLRLALQAVDTLARRMHREHPRFLTTRPFAGSLLRTSHWSGESVRKMEME